MDKTEITVSQKIARGVLLAVVIFGALLAIIVIGSFVMFEVAGKQAESSIGKFKPDTAGLYDGVYYGECIAFGAYTAAEVEFEAADGELIKIEFTELFQTPGHDAGNRVRERIEGSGDLRFDTVTGATRTSSFAKAAIKDAVITGPIVEYEGLSDIDFR